MHRACLLALLLLSMPLAGCIGGDEDPDEDLDTQERAEVTESTGGIQGVVTDAAVEAIQGATVNLTDTGASTESAADGSFAFSELIPGTYTLTFDADGFLSTEKEVAVDANEVTILDVVLTEEPEQLPYKQEFEYTGFMECSWGAAGVVFIASQNTCSLVGNATNTQTTFTHQMEPDAWQVVTEVDWDPNSPLSDRFWMNVETTGFNSAWKVAYANTQETPPIVFNTDRQHLTNVAKNFTAICEGEEDPSTTSNQVGNPDAYCGHAPIDEGASLDINVLVQTAEQATVDEPEEEGLFPAGAGLAVQQEFTVYQTIFYQAPACDDYSILLDNQCPQADQTPDEDPYEEWIEGDD